MNNEEFWHGLFVGIFISAATLSVGLLIVGVYFKHRLRWFRRQLEISNEELRHFIRSRDAKFGNPQPNGEKELK